VTTLLNNIGFMYNIFCCSGFTWLDGLVG